MMNYFQLYNCNSRVWNGYNYHRYPSNTISYENYSAYGPTIQYKEYQSKNDLFYKSSLYDFHGHANTCIDSPLDLSKGSTLFHREKIIENVDQAQVMKSENGLDFEGNNRKYDNYPINLSKAAICHRKIIGRDYSMGSRVSDESSQPKVRRRTMYCNYCPYITNHKNDLRKHMYGAHYTTSSVVCPRCGITCKHKYSLKVHLSYCGKEPRFCCAYCPYKSRKRNHLQKHALKHVERNAAEVMRKVSGLLPMSMPPYNQTSDTLASREAEQQPVEVQRTFTVEVMPKASSLFPLSIPPCNIDQKTEQKAVEEQGTFNVEVMPKASSLFLLPIPTSNYISNASPNRKSEQKAVEKQRTFNVEVMPRASSLFPLSIPPCNQNNDRIPSHKIEQKALEEQPKFNVKECPGCGKIFKHWGLMQRHYKYCSGNCIQCKHCPYKAKDSTMLEIHVSSAHPVVSSEEALIQIVDVKIEYED